MTLAQAARAGKPQVAGPHDADAPPTEDEHQLIVNYDVIDDVRDSSQNDDDAEYCASCEICPIRSREKLVDEISIPIIGRAVQDIAHMPSDVDDVPMLNVATGNINADNDVDVGKVGGIGTR